LSSVRLLPRLTSSLAAGLDPLPHLGHIGACSSAQHGLGQEPRRLGTVHLGPSQGHACMLCKQIRPGERPQLGDGLVLVLDPAASHRRRQTAEIFADRIWSAVLTSLSLSHCSDVPR
jgi:hypothetical protein